MKRRIRNKFFMWTVMIFGTLGISMPIVARYLAKSSEIFIIDEMVLNLSTYSVAILTTSIYKQMMKEAEASDSFVNKLMDSFGYLFLTGIYLIFINDVLSRGLSNLGLLLASFLTAVAYYFWFAANPATNYGTGALGD